MTLTVVGFFFTEVQRMGGHSSCPQQTGHGTQVPGAFIGQSLQ